MSSLKELLTEVLEREIARLKQKELLTDDDVARIPALARAAEIVQGLRAGTTTDERTAAELEALTHGR